MICIWKYDNDYERYADVFADVDKPRVGDVGFNENKSVWEGKIIKCFKDINIKKNLNINSKSAKSFIDIINFIGNNNIVIPKSNNVEIENTKESLISADQMDIDDSNIPEVILLENAGKNNVNNFNYENKSEHLKYCHVDSFNVFDTIDNTINRTINFRKRLIKSHIGDIWIKVAIWNLQSLNLKLKQRYTKLEYLRDFFNENKFDILWLIDVNDTDTVILNGFKKYTDNRSILFVKDSIESEFTVSKNLIFSEFSKLAFIYITPNNNDEILLDNFRSLVNLDYSIFGDFNLKSNKIINKNVMHFCGEDSLQVGAISKKLIKYYSFAAPSDHRLVVCETKAHCKFNVALRVCKVNVEEAFVNISKIMNGELPDFRPKVKIQQTYFSLNDRENTLNAMINDYLKNNVSKIYKKYNYLWKYDRREPFLGKNVCDGVKTSYAVHLKENKDKVYLECFPLILHEEAIKRLSVKSTYSKALNDDSLALCDISNATSAVFFKKETCREEVMNHLVNMINKCKENLNAETFFLQKNKVVKEFSDVRVIIIIPTLVKMYESIVYDVVSEYVSNLFNDKGIKYQYGAIKGGSTYKAMIDLRLKMEKFGNKGVLFLDISKGYDNLDHGILSEAIMTIENEDIKQILLNWANMVFNIDVVVNNEKIKKTRGVPMGLSISPIAFILYVDYVLRDVPKDRLVMYIDDLAIVIDLKISPEDNLEFILSIITKLENAFLIVNKKKTVVITAEDKIRIIFGDVFPIVNKEKYLGRLIGLNGDGTISNDDRFYNMNAFRTNAFPYWTHFFVKRLIGVSALDAKLRYRMMMWSTADICIRTSIWRHNWCFFKKGMGIYSYTQMVYSSFNLFRYFIDPVDIINWSNKWTTGGSQDIICSEIKKKIMVKEKDEKDRGMIMINKAISDLKINFNLGFEPSDDVFAFTKIFLNNLWKQFQDNMLNLYLQEKSEKGINVYPKIKTFIREKIYNHSGILQKLGFKHFSPNKRLRNKQIFELAALDNILKEVKEKFNKKEVINNDAFFEFNDVFDVNNLLALDDNQFNLFCEVQYEEYWPLLDIIAESYRRAHFKVDKTAQIEKEINEYKYLAFIDGSCVKDAHSPDSGKVGFGCYIYINDGINNDKVFQLNGQVTDKEYCALENVGGELISALEAIKFAMDKQWPYITICYDYLGIEMFAKGKWHTTNAAVLDFIYKYNLYNKKVDVHFVKVPAHTGIKGNEYADMLAKAAVNIKTDGKINVIHTISETDKAFYKGFYKEIFKTLIMIEMVALNPNTNDLSVSELFFNTRVKKFNLNEFLEKNFHLLETADADPLDIEYNDVMLE